MLNAVVIMAGCVMSGGLDVCANTKDLCIL